MVCQRPVAGKWFPTAGRKSVQLNSGGLAGVGDLVSDLDEFALEVGAVLFRERLDLGHEVGQVLAGAETEIFLEGLNEGRFDHGSSPCFALQNCRAD